MAQAGSGGGQHHRHLEAPLASELLLAHDALDLALRGDAHLLEETAQREIEAFLVHRRALSHRCVGLTAPTWLTIHAPSLQAAIAAAQSTTRALPRVRLPDGRER